MSKITSLITSLHEGHKTEERLKCIDNMLFNKCEDTKDTILQAFWWYRKHSIPINRIKQAREEIESINEVVHDGTNHYYKDCVETKKEVLAILDKLIAESEGVNDGV